MARTKQTARKDRILRRSVVEPKKTRGEGRRVMRKTPELVPEGDNRTPRRV